MVLVLALVLGSAGVAWAAFTSSVTASFSVSTATLPAPTPTSLHPNTSGANAGYVQLTLPAVSPAIATTYDIQRATAPAGPWTTLATVPASTTTYTDTTAAYNAQYDYQVTSHLSNWTASSNPADMAFSLPSTAGSDATASLNGTALTGPWTTAGTNLAALASADGTRYTTAGPWTSVPLGGAAWLFGVAALDPTHVWTSGTGGTLLFWDGNSWASQTTGTTQDLYDVFFVDATHGWAVGRNGVIIATSDGGATWTAQTSGTTQLLSQVVFVSPTKGWIVGAGGTILTTSNAGATWTAQTSGTTQWLLGASFVSATQGWAVGFGGTILTTANGGATWTAQTSGTTGYLIRVQMTSASQGVAVGQSGMILTTANGGTTWTPRASGFTADAYDVSMASPTVGWVVGAGGQIVKTTDGGATWTAQASGSTNPLFGVQFVSTTTGWAVGQGDAVLTTTNGGATWSSRSSQRLDLTPLVPTLAPGATVSTVKVTLVYRTSALPSAGTTFTLLASADAGATWTSYALTAPAAANTDVTQTVDLSGIGWSPATRLQNLRLRFVAQVPTGGTTFTTSHDLVHVDVN